MTLLKIIEPPSLMEGGAIARVVQFADGSGRVETWCGKEWVPGGTKLSEFFTVRPASAIEMAEAGIPNVAG